MRVFIDTNILISAALNPNGTTFKAYCRAVSYPNDGIICEQNVDELKGYLIENSYSYENSMNFFRFY